MSTARKAWRPPDPGVAAPGGDPFRERPGIRERRALAGHARHSGGGGQWPQARPLTSTPTMSRVAHERTALTNAGALTERVAAKGRRQGCVGVDEVGGWVRRVFGLGAAALEQNELRNYLCFLSA